MADDETMWVVVVPVKPAAAGKARLAGSMSDDRRERLVRAMALDTVAAASATRGVARVVVVTADPELRTSLDATVDLVDDPGTGLNGAVAAGVARARRVEPGAGTAALLGDLPALRPDDLRSALVLAQTLPRALVADAEGTGTTLLTGLGELTPLFGAGSASRHEAAGHVRLDIPSDSSLRRDVDVPADLGAVARLGVGPHTAAVLSGKPADEG